MYKFVNTLLITAFMALLLSSAAKADSKLSYKEVVECTAFFFISAEEAASQGEKELEQLTTEAMMIMFNRAQKMSGKTEEQVTNDVVDVSAEWLQSMGQDRNFYNSLANSKTDPCVDAL